MTVRKRFTREEIKAANCQHPSSHAAKLLTHGLAAPDTSITGISNE